MAAGRPVTGNAICSEPAWAAPTRLKTKAPARCAGWRHNRTLIVQLVKSASGTVSSRTQHSCCGNTMATVRRLDQQVLALDLSRPCTCLIQELHCCPVVGWPVMLEQSTRSARSAAAQAPKPCILWRLYLRANLDHHACPTSTDLRTLIWLVASKPSSWFSSSSMVRCTSLSPPPPPPPLPSRALPMESTSSMKMIEGACSLRACWSESDDNAPC